MKKPSNWVPDAGLCMHVNKEPFLDAMAKAKHDGAYIYVEIGVFNGNTTRWACDWMSGNCEQWAAYGVEVKEWMPHVERFKKCLGTYWDGSIVESVDNGIDHHTNGVRVFTCGSERFLKAMDKTPTFVFIDGCHSTKCCTSDFLLSEKISSAGTVVAIHDIDRGYQGLDPGLHCKEGIGVLKAIKQLGLFDAKRDGWTEIGRTPEGYENHGCLFVIKT